MSQLLASVVTACKDVVVDGDDDADLLLSVLATCDVADLVELIAVMGGLLVRLLSDVAEAEGSDIDSFIQQWALRLAE